MKYKAKRRSAGEVLPPTFEQRVYTIEDIMGILKIGRNSAYTLAKSGVFNCVKIGGHYRISRMSFDNWLEGTKGGINNGR